MVENKWIVAYRQRLNTLQRTLQECIYKNTADGVLNLQEVSFILNGALQELESQHKEIVKLKQTNLTLKSAINDDMDKLKKAVTGA